MAHALQTSKLPLFSPVIFPEPSWIALGTLQISECVNISYRACRLSHITRHLHRPQQDDRPQSVTGNFFNFCFLFHQELVGIYFLKAILNHEQQSLSRHWGRRSTYTDMMSPPELLWWDIKIVWKAAWPKLPYHLITTYFHDRPSVN